MRDEASELDRALNGTEPGSDPLVHTARELEDRFRSDVPEASRERALFVEGIAAQAGHGPWWRVAAPAVVMAGLFVLFLMVAGRALPGDSLYPVREVMGSVGLADPGTHDIRRVIREAGDHVTAARVAADERPAVARREAIFALGRLGVAREWLGHVGGATRAELIADIERIERQATAALFLASEEAERLEERAERIEDRLEESGGDDSSGPGSGDDDGGDDNSGPGSGDDDGGDDNSGPGSGDDDGTDDSSGPGSGDDDGSDDSSGPGSGDDDVTDNSGSGSDDSGSDDSSGTGSGSDDSSGSSSGDD